MTHTSPAATNLDKNDEYCGTEIEGRNTFKNWKRSMTLEEKGDIVLQFVLNHQDEATMTHRWRTKMIKRLTGDFREHALAINQRLDRQEELMNAQQRTLEALQRALAAQHGGRDVEIAASRNGIVFGTRRIRKEANQNSVRHVSF